MTKYEELVTDSQKDGLYIIELDFGNNKPCGKCIGKNIVINKNISDAEKYCVLCEELGHYYLTIGDITNQSILSNIKQEKLARKWGYEKNVGLLKLIEAFEEGCLNKYEIATFLNVTEEYLEQALKYYKEKYGISYIIDCYYITFIPNLTIAKALF